ncbi:hypothetical protein NPIL_255771 [Nephila pilipes]|uniref:Uncharacterized protein n=1 Tax=Nephila pilipes TaxID=299642 RepID=A0A8X6PSG0_NEPPI|nr:hypothetical protein NPIL_255771 [Nephila pilipes]
MAPSGLARCTAAGKCNEIGSFAKDERLTPNRVLCKFYECLLTERIACCCRQRTPPPTCYIILGEGAISDFDSDDSAEWSVIFSRCRLDIIDFFPDSNGDVTAELLPSRVLSPVNSDLDPKPPSPFIDSLLYIKKMMIEIM